jgi:DNA phosphorothioation-dependent restriction protein DptG
MQTILQFHNPNKSTKYNMLGTKNQVSNATTGKIVLFLEHEEQSGKLGKISNPREDRDVTGCQLYSPFTNNFFKDDVRADQKLLNRFPTYIMDLLSSSLHNFSYKGTIIIFIPNTGLLMAVAIFTDVCSKPKKFAAAMPQNLRLKTIIHSIV